MVHVNRHGTPKLTEEGKAAFSEIGEHWHEQDTGIGKCGHISHSPIARLYQRRRKRLLNTSSRGL